MIFSVIQPSRVAEDGEYADPESDCTRPLSPGPEDPQVPIEAQRLHQEQQEEVELDLQTTSQNLDPNERTAPEEPSNIEDILAGLAEDGDNISSGSNENDYLSGEIPNERTPESPERASPRAIMPGGAFEPNISEIQRAMQSLQVEDEEASSIRSDSSDSANREEPKPYEFGCSGRGTDDNDANDNDYENNDDDNNNDDDDVLDNKTEHLDDQSNNSNTEDDNENPRINQNSYTGSDSETTTSVDSHSSALASCGRSASDNPDPDLDLHSNATNSSGESDSPVVVHQEANIVPQAVTIIGVDNGLNTPNFQLTKKDVNSDQNLNIIAQATWEEKNGDQLEGRNSTDDQQDEENDTGHYASGKITLMIPWTEEVDVNSDQ